MTDYDLSKKPYAQAKEEAALDKQFCPHCNPCLHTTNPKCRAPASVEAEPELRERMPQRADGEGYVSYAKRVADLCAKRYDATERLTRERKKADSASRAAHLAQMKRAEQAERALERMRKALQEADAKLAGMWSYDEAGRALMLHTWSGQASEILRDALKE